MNELNEQHLRSWAPRRPSAGLKARIFRGQNRTATGQDSPEPVVVEPTFRFAWLVPVTAALLLVCVFFGQRNSATISSTRASREMIAVALSNQSAAAWLPRSFACAQNSLPKETFEWTNGKGSTPGFGSSASAGTN